MVQKTEFISRAGWKHVYTLKEGEKWCIYRGHIIVTHPERQPKIVNPDGTEEEITLGK